MKTYRVFLGLGANMGERAASLNAAAAAVKGLPGTTIVWFSSVYETDPYGKADQPRFLNAVGEIETTLGPPDLLDQVKAIERAMGRTANERWGPREIDIDILPHADLEHRRFVLVPFREIAPDVVHPVSGMTVEEMAAACRETGRVTKTSYHIRL